MEEVIAELKALVEALIERIEVLEEYVEKLRYPGGDW